MSDAFTCERCGTLFTVPAAALERYPGWTPRSCLPCRDEHRPPGQRPRKGTPAPSSPSPAARTAGGSGGDMASEHPALLRVLDRHHDGPDTGLFTDGSCSPNPGPGGWGVVWVDEGVILDQRWGHEASSTNNRMELRALIEAFRMVPEGTAVTIHCDSQLAVRTVNEWAPGWKRRGWTRRTGPVENLDLVRVLHDLKESRPEIDLRWVPSHSGWRWNEYADALARHLGLGGWP